MDNVTDEMISAFVVAAKMGDGNLESDDPALKGILENTKSRVRDGLSAALNASQKA